MRKLLKALALLAVILSANIVFATVPIDNLPDRDAKEPKVVTEEVLSDPMAEDAVPQIKTVPVTAKIDEASEIKPYDEKNVPKETMPEPAGEFQKLVFIFLKVMLAVIIATVAIYLLLLFVRKFFSGQAGLDYDNQMKDNLKSSQNDAEALKIFLNKTKNH